MSRSDDEAIDDLCKAIQSSSVSELDEFEGVIATNDKTQRILNKVNFLVALDSETAGGLLCFPNRRHTRRFRWKAAAAIVAFIVCATMLLHSVQLQRHKAHFAGLARDSNGSTRERGLHAQKCLNPRDAEIAKRYAEVRKQQEYNGAENPSGNYHVVPESSSIVLVAIGSVSAFFAFHRYFKSRKD